MNSSTLTLDAEVTIPFAAATREQLLEALRSCQGDLTLDLSGVTDFDSSGVQLLLSTHRSLQEAGHALLLQAPTACVRDALQTLGLSHTWTIANSSSAAEGTAS